MVAVTPELSATSRTAVRGLPESTPIRLNSAPAAVNGPGTGAAGGSTNRQIQVVYCP